MIGGEWSGQHRCSVGAFGQVVDPQLSEGQDRRGNLEKTGTAMPVNRL